MKLTVPKEFVRKPRSIDEVTNWKATEYRNFFIAFKSISFNWYSIREVYDNFPTLHVAMVILASRKLNAYATYANDLLKKFVVDFAKIYGAHHLSHNVQSL